MPFWLAHLFDSFFTRFFHALHSPTLNSFQFLKDASSLSLWDCAFAAHLTWNMLFSFHIRFIISSGSTRFLFPTFSGSRIGIRCLHLWCISSLFGINSYPISICHLKPCVLTPAYSSTSLSCLAWRQKQYIIGICILNVKEIFIKRENTAIAWEKPMW